MPGTGSGGRYNNKHRGDKGRNVTTTNSVVTLQNVTVTTGEYPVRKYTATACVVTLQKNDHQRRALQQQAQI